MNQQTQTQAASACPIPAVGKDLLQVQAGVPIFHALSTAQCLDLSVIKLLETAIGNGDGMDADTAFLCRFALDVSGALRAAAGASA